MNELLSNLFTKYGISALIGAIIAVIIVWFAAHNMSAPGEKVSVIWGLVEYTKPSENVGRGVVINRESASSESQLKDKSKLVSQPLNRISVEIEIVPKENIKNVLTALRKKYSLRPLTSLESGKSISETAKGTYFFTLDRWLGNITFPQDNFETDFQQFDVSKYSNNFNLEIHHTSEDAFYLVGFISNTHAAEISELSGIERKKMARRYSEWVMV